ncbi:hypothetical protein BRC64_03555 [Halobacteriales archaeon QH_10_67_22]|jgi:hypothetical protein|nr:MAG: hypothetical protein BRC64_03555 [Halobacteriales archaeon QH_10_67_22]
MSLSEETRQRLADVVALQPTKNGELQEKWGMDSGSEVHQYLESELKEYYYRNEDSLICATPEAASLVGAEGAGETMTVTPLQYAVLDVLAGPEDEPDSVVATLHGLRDAGSDPAVEEVRRALRSLAEKGLVDRVERAVPTYRLALDRDTLDVDTVEE